jgi:hypothetical protein
VFRRDGSDRALIVDPGDEAEKLLHAIDALGVTLDGILLTHAHSDHAGGAADLAARTGAPVAVHEADAGLAELDYARVAFTHGPEITERAREAVMRELRSHFRPEFLNRVDDIVLFRPLRLEEIERIVDLQTEDLRKRLADRGVRLELSDPAREYVARQGFDPIYGARPLKRFLQHELESKIGRALVAGEVRDGALLRVDVKGGHLDVEILNPQEAEVTVEA